MAEWAEKGTLGRKVTMVKEIPLELFMPKNEEKRKGSIHYESGEGKTWRKNTC